MTTLTRIENLIKQKRYQEALSECDEMLDKDPESLSDVSRLRSWLFTRQGDYRAGIDELVRILELGKATVGDFHSAAFWSLFDGKPTQAREWFEVVLERGRQENDSWFESSALFYIAYLHANCGQYDEAEKYLDRPGNEDENSPVLIPPTGFSTRRELRQLIKDRRSQDERKKK